MVIKLKGEAILPRGSIQGPDGKHVFGTRKLENEECVYDQNAWDDPEWTASDGLRATQAIEFQKLHPVSEELLTYYDSNESRFWDEFYSNHQDKFFRDRKWLPVECPEIFHPDSQGLLPLKFAELGCGVGNTIIPILSYMNNPQGAFIYGLDYSSVAINLLKNHKDYDPSVVHAFTFDITSNEDICANIPKESIDICFAIFVLSAIKPSKWKDAVENIYKILKPGGIVIFRDYGMYDMVQLRFKKERLIGENFYVRGDGTKVFFFSTSDLESIFPRDKFEILQNEYDRRLLVNRTRLLKMSRVWVRAKFRKIVV